MEHSTEWIIFDGKLQPANEPVARPSSRGLMYGEGLFETFRIYNGKSLLFERHMERLRRGAELLAFALEDLPDAATLQIHIRSLLEKNELLQQDAIVRCQWWQDGSRGYHPTPEGQLHYMMTASKCPDFSNHYPALKTVSIPRIPAAALPTAGKFSNGINYILAAREAARSQADDALMLTTEGYISETTVANIFWIRDTQIFTPAEGCDLLPGITRRTVMDLVGRHPDLRLQEGMYPVDEIDAAEAVFICNSVREVLAVREIDGRHYDTDHPVLTELKQLYSDYRDQHLKGLSDVE